MHTDVYVLSHQLPMGKLDRALDEAQQRGWIVVGMKNDFKEVFK